MKDAYNFEIGGRVLIAGSQVPDTSRPKEIVRITQFDDNNRGYGARPEDKFRGVETIVGDSYHSILRALNAVMLVNPRPEQIRSFLEMFTDVRVVETTNELAV